MIVVNYYIKFFKVKLSCLNFSAIIFVYQQYFLYFCAHNCANAPNLPVK